MHRKVWLFVLICFVSFVVASPLIAEQGKKYGKLYLREYAAKSADETAIMDTLIQYEKAFNSHDLQKLLSLFEKDAVYRPCGVDWKNSIGSKDCQNRLKVNFITFGFETYYDPVISVTGSDATVKLLLETGPYLADYTMTLKKEEHGWLVASCDYRNDHNKP
jgi:hypothetical protein